MRNIYVFFIGLLLFLGVDNAFSQDPYADGTSLAAGTTINVGWSVASGTVVNAEGDLRTTQKGVVSGEMNIIGTLDAVSVDVYGTLNVGGNYIRNDWAGLHIYSGGVVEITGYFQSNQQIIVDEGGTLIVHDYLYSNNKITVNGNLIVLGSVTTSGSAAIEIGANGNLVIGQNLDAGNDVNIDGENNDNIYFLSADATIDYPTTWGDHDLHNGYGTAIDFVNNESTTNPDLFELVQDLGLIGSGPIVGTYSESGSYTFTVPAGVTSLTVECWGAGGAGGGSRNNNRGGSGGGGGAYCSSVLTVTPGQVISYTVGAGGTGTTNDGANGGSTSFLTLTANGGTGGARNSGSIGIGGTATGGTTNTTGENGTVGDSRGQAGGAGANGGDGGAGNVQDDNGNAGNSPGGGGSGGELNRVSRWNQIPKSGGNGADGQVTITFELPAAETGPVYYSYRSGNWNAVSTWTHDPGGTTQTATDIPTDDSRVVILNGRTVTLTSDVTNTGLSMSILSGGFVNMATYRFINTLDELSGQGTLKLASANFPVVSKNNLVTTNGGTVEYNNSSDIELPSTQTEYNHLIINGSAVATQKHDLTLYGDLHIKQGTYRINDGSTARYQLAINGNVTVDSGASITVGTGNTIANDVSGGTAPFIDYYIKQTHRVVVNGDFTNNGTVRFTNQSYPQYRAFPTNGAATVYFMGAADNTLTCNSQTDFYNLVLDKGTDQTFKLTVNSSSYSNFRLYGRNSYGGDTSASGGSDQNPNLRKALWIRTGSLVLQGLTAIPSLTEGGDGGTPNSDFYIPVNGALILDGSDVVVLSTADDYTEVNAAYGLTGGNNSTYNISEGSNAESFSIYGKVQINDGYLSTRESGGFITWDMASGEFIVNGGTVDAKQFRAAGGSDGLASYTQTGGTVILRGQLQRSTASLSSVSDLVNANLDLTRNTNGLDGSKGTLNINNPDNIFSMSGGTIKILDLCGISNGSGYAIDIFSAEKNINVSGGTIEVNPQKDNYTFKIRSAASFGNFVVNRVSGNSEVQLNNSDLPIGVTVDGSLTVLDNITITNGVFNANGFDVNVGGNFSIADGTTYTTGANRTVFNGNKQQKLVVNLSSALSLNKLVINNTSDKILLDGTQTVINVSDSLIITNGELDDNAKTINVSGNIYNAGVHSGDGQIVMSGTSINGNGSGQFKNIVLNGTGEITLDANTTVNGVLTFNQDYLLNIGTNNISFAADASITGASSLRYIKSAGNAGDGGVTFNYNSATSKNWPMGVDVYSPATIGFSSAPSTYGSITIVPVNYEHPVTTTDGEALSYFWRVKSSGFSGIEGIVSHTFNYDQLDVQGTESAYLPARYDATAYEWNKGTVSDVDESNNQINNWTAPTLSADFIDGDYTAGLNSAFGTPTKYYSRADGLWNNASTWSTTSHTGASASSFPGSGDIVIIGNGNTVSLQRWNNTPDRDPEYSASLQVEYGATLDATYNPGSDFGMIVTHPSGNGTIRISAAYDYNTEFEFPNGDFSDYNSNGGTTEFYTLNPNPSLINYFPDGVKEYGNLTITLAGASNVVFANHDVHIKGDLTMNGTSADSWFCPTWGSSGWNEKTITIDGDFDIVGGSFFWNYNNNVRQDVVVKQDLIVGKDKGGIGSRGAYNQSISIGGSFINNSSAYDSYSNTYGAYLVNVPLIFYSDSNSKITSTEGSPRTTFESVKVNKGASQLTTLTMDIAGAVSYATDKWLNLINGTFIYNRNVNVSIYSGDSFSIPGTSGLIINTTNTFDICRGNNSNDDDVYLNGKLTVIEGTVRIGDSSRNINNDIEYSGGGLSEINVQGGSLFVNGQIRRNPASSAGILKYNQSGGTVSINGRNTLATNAKLEVLNTGSEFNMSDGTLTIVRGGGTTYGDLYLRPENSSVTGGEIIFDNSGVGDQDYLLDSNVSLNDLTVNGNGSTATVELLLSPLTLNGDLTLANSNSVLDANTDYSIDVTIEGDFNNNGVYNYYGNTTTFSGGTQQITGTADIEFYNLVVNSLTSLTINNDVTVYNDLTLRQGTLAAGIYTINAKGDVINNATYTSSGSGLVLNGSDSQELSGTGTFARVELANSNGAVLANDITINGELALTYGILNVKNYLLSLAESASVSGSFGVNNMITTNGVYSNSGIKKVFSSGDTPAFTFPIGVNGKYTPAILDLSASDNAASIQIHPVDYKHPANIDETNVLDYFWAVESEALSNASGLLTFTYVDEDIQGDESQYYAARLLVPGSSWTKNNTVDEANNLISFTISGNNISGEYTAGLESAFPDNVPEYTSNADGDWSDSGIWTQTGGDTYSLTGAPNGFIVVVNNEVALDENFAQAYRTTISADAKLKIDDVTYGHNLGTVSGSGTLYLEQGNLPEGNYDAFLGCNNSSTLEFGGVSNDYSILADLFNNAANLLFSGTGTRTLPNADLTICKTLVIDGPVLDNSVFNRTIYVNGSFTRLSGSFYSGTGSTATVSFTGSVQQYVGGFTGVNTLNNLEVNNSAGLIFDDDIEVAGNLLLTNGLITTSATNTLTITNTSNSCVTPSEGKTTSYVNGPLTKKMNQSDSFVFPIGIDGELGSKLKITAVQTGTKQWTAEYKRPNSTYENYSFPLTAINSHEYWCLSTPGGGQAKVQLGWDSGSDITPGITEHGLTDIRVVNYDGADWQEIASTASGSETSGSVITDSRVTVAEGGTDFTTATVNTNKPKVRFNPDGSLCDLSTGIKVELISTVPTVADYELSYSIDGTPQTAVAVSSFPYYLPTPSVGVYEITGFKYDNKIRVGVYDATAVEVFPTPTTADAGEDQSLQGLTQATLDGNSAVVGSGVWSIVSGTGGSFVDPIDPVTKFNGTAGTSYVLNWTITYGDCQSVDQVNIAFPLVPPHVWLGITNDWFTSSNWSDGIIPDETVDITLNAVTSPKVNAVINSTAVAKVKNLTIASSASLTLTEGAKFTISGDLITNDNLNIQTSVTSPVSVIAYGNVVGNANYEWTGLTNMYWWHIGLPVTGVSNSDFDTSYGDTDYALNRYTTSGWERIAGINEVDADYSFSSDLLEGYSLLPRYDFDLKYSGVLNNGDYSQSFSNAGWYLIANPYPSYLDVEDAGFDKGNFINTIFIDGYDNTISIYNTLTNIGINNGSRYVAPGQAMWLRTYRATDAISIANTAQVHSTGSLKSSDVEDDNIFRFTLSGNNNTDESAVLISEDFGSELVSVYDSEKKMNGGNMLNVYSLKENKNIAINTLPYLESEQIIPVGYTVSSAGLSEFTFKASNINSFMNDVDVYLVDNTEGITINLREEPTYTFTPSTTESNDRLELRFKMSMTTDIDDAKAVVSNRNVSIYAVGQEATVKVTEDVLLEKDRLIEVYDISGSIVKQLKLNDIETTFTLPQTNAVYIIAVKAGGYSYQQKVVTQN